MKTAIVSSLLVALLLPLAGPVVNAQSVAPAALDLGDRELFPPDFFPGLEELSEAELLLAGLRQMFPQRILAAAPESPLPAPAAPVVRDLGREGTYIRILNLSDALPVIRKHLSRQVLILDLRFLAADLPTTVELGALLSRQSRLRLEVAGEYPVDKRLLSDGEIWIESDRQRGANNAVFTLSNHKTSGPLEALLAQLQADGEIISIGTRSAGRTGFFQPFPGLSSYHLIRGELRPGTGTSLVDGGFVPQVAVDVSSEDDLIAYGALKEDVEIEQLVQARVTKPRFDEARLLRERGTPSGSEDQPTDEEGEPALPLDHILQRAINIVKALQALGQIG